MLARLALLTTLTAGCQSPPPPKEFDGAAALEYARQQLAFGPRVPGTDAHRAMGAWLDSLARAKADSVVLQDFTHETRSGETIALRNVIARFNPAAADRLLFLAHWDTRPVADADTGANRSRPVPGANDGASGVGVLLAMADALRAAPPAVGVDLLFVDGEDFGDFGEDVDVLIGSRHYASNQVGPRPAFAVLLDMVGARNAQFRKEGNSVIAAPAVVDLVWETAERLGHGAVFLPEAGGTVTDDHVPLQKAGIKAIDVIPEIPHDYRPWHTLDDTIDRLSVETLTAVGDVMMAVIRSHGR
ncbi:MAG: M28 family peptidase [Gemmatimonadales bacterium]